MRIERVLVRDFRSYEEAELEFGQGLTIVHGRNGAGKTNLLEGLYLGCTGRSFRTSDERRLVRSDARFARIAVFGVDADGPHELGVVLEPGVGKRMTADGAPVERLAEVAFRPLVAVFSPDRLELVKGSAGLRRAHLDQFVAALWPARVATRREYRAALAQRNALLGRVRAGRVGVDALAPWDLTLADAGVRLMADRREAVALIADGFARNADALGLPGDAELSYRPRVEATSGADFVLALQARLERDVERGLTLAGPHRDELALERDGRPLRHYGSQGEQRLALLALLLAERDALAEHRRQPLLLLDDVMSELDLARRELLAAQLRGGGQAVVTATEPDHVPGWDSGEVARIALP